MKPGQGRQRAEQATSEPSAAEAPEGWHRVRVYAGFLHTVGPIYWRETEGQLALGFRVGAEHSNITGFCHGGMLATFADITLGFGVGHAVGTGAFAPTVVLNCEFLAPAPQGSFVTGAAQILKLGRSTGFARCLLNCSETGDVMHASGTFQLGRPVNPKFAIAEMLTRG